MVYIAYVGYLFNIYWYYSFVHGCWYIERG